MTDDFPLPKPIMYYVAIRDVVTGELREAPQRTPWSAGDLFWWQEGSFSCDCNRELEFARAGGDPIRDDPGNHYCLGHKRFRVESIRLANGVVIPFDDFRFEGA